MVKEAEEWRKKTEDPEGRAGVDSAQKTEEKGANKQEKEKDTIKELQHKLKEAEEKSLYLSAEFQNFRKRIEKEKVDFLKYGHEDFIRDLLFVQDNFERALGHADSEEMKRENSKEPQILEGLKMIMRQFLEALEKQGVQAVEALGKDFDPNLHEAMAEREVEKKKPGTIISEHLKGYKLHDRVLRAAKVVVVKEKSNSRQKENLERKKHE